MDYLIRKCTEKDLPELIQLCKKHSEYEHVPYIGVGKEDALKNAIFKELPNLYCYVIEDEKKLVGYFTYNMDFSTWDARPFLHLDCLYLEPEYRGLRIGDKVMEVLKAIGIENKCVNLQWQTPIFNEPAIRFYKRIGAVGRDKVRFFFEL